MRRAGGEVGLLVLVEDTVGGFNGSGSSSSVGGTQVGVILSERFLGGPDGSLAFFGAILGCWLNDSALGCDLTECAFQVVSNPSGLVGG